MIARLLSIIIPAYNAEKYIAETIESALQQTVRNYEVIIVNDGSNDNTEQIIDQYREHPIVKIYGYKVNRGAPHAYNHGLLHSQAKYVTFLDADDLFLPNYCERVLDAIESQGADLGFANLFTLDGYEKRSTTLYGMPRDQRFFNLYGGPERTFPNDPIEIRKLVLQGVHISPRSIYKRSLFLDYGLEDHRLRITHDWLRHIKFIINGAKCVYVNEPLGYYRFHSEGNSQKDQLANYIENIKIMEIIINEMGKLLNTAEMGLTKTIYKQMRNSVFQVLSDSPMTTAQIVQYLSDKQF